MECQELLRLVAAFNPIESITVWSATHGSTSAWSAMRHDRIWPEEARSSKVQVRWTISTSPGQWTGTNEWTHQRSRLLFNVLRGRSNRQRIQSGIIARPPNRTVSLGALDEVRNVGERSGVILLHDDGDACRLERTVKNAGTRKLLLQGR